MRCAEAREAWFGPGGWQEPLHERVRGLLGLPSDAGPQLACRAVRRRGVRCRCAAALPVRPTCRVERGDRAEGAALISALGWRSIRPARAEALDELQRRIVHTEGQLRARLTSQEKLDPSLCASRP